MMLSESEYSGLTKIARKTKCDCWFDIRQDKNGNDYVFDLENRKRISLRAGMLQLFEAVISPLTEYGLTNAEMTAMQGLMKKSATPK